MTCLAPSTPSLLSLIFKLVIAPMVGMALVIAITPDMSASPDKSLQPMQLAEMLSSVITWLPFSASARALVPGAQSIFLLMSNFTNAPLASRPTAN